MVIGLVFVIVLIISLYNGVSMGEMVFNNWSKFVPIFIFLSIWFLVKDTTKRWFFGLSPSYVNIFFVFLFVLICWYSF